LTIQIIVICYFIQYHFVVIFLSCIAGSKMVAAGI